MVTLHLLQYLSDEGFGTIDTSLFWEKLPLKGKGIAIYSRGTPLSRGTRTSQAFDLYSRGVNDLSGADALEKVQEFIDAHYVACDLPVVPDRSNKLYTRCTIQMSQGVENLGLDENDRVVFRIAGVITYNRTIEQGD